MALSVRGTRSRRAPVGRLSLEECKLGELNSMLQAVSGTNMLLHRRTE